MRKLFTLISYSPFRKACLFSLLCLAMGVAGAQEPVATFKPGADSSEAPAVMTDEDYRTMPKIITPINLVKKMLPEWVHKRSGWGYTQETAVRINSKSSIEGIGHEYDFAKLRSQIEVVNIFQMHYAGFKLIRQQLVFKEKKPYDVLQFYVYYLTDEDWEYLKSDYENHNQYEGDEEGLKKHNEMMEEMVKSYKSECWIDISKFFGKF